MAAIFAHFPVIIVDFKAKIHYFVKVPFQVTTVQIWDEFRLRYKLPHTDKIIVSVWETPVCQNYDESKCHGYFA